ncbi:hypothetical protein [Microbacterium gilvum]|uniref:Tail assembly chaperone n=1 Tax=Microbacterium gilvum TaxID=1336204 RepID=A0ABP9A8R1_9MICO
MSKNRKIPQDHRPKASEVEAPEPAEDRADPTVTLDGVEYTVNLAALADPRTASALGLMQELADASAAGQEPDHHVVAELNLRVPALIRRLVGARGEAQALDKLAAKHGSLNIAHVVQFVYELIKEARPNS